MVALGLPPRWCVSPSKTTRTCAQQRGARILDGTIARVHGPLDFYGFEGITLMCGKNKGGRGLNSLRERFDESAGIKSDPCFVLVSQAVDLVTQTSKLFAQLSDLVGLVLKFARL